MSGVASYIRGGKIEGRRFRQALDDTIDQGLQIPCRDNATSHLWLSNHVGERAHAADLCWDCPVIFECRAMAEARGEVFGVYGGKDVTKPGYSGLGK